MLSAGCADEGFRNRPSKGGIGQRITARNTGFSLCLACVTDFSLSVYTLRANAAATGTCSKISTNLCIGALALDRGHQPRVHIRRDGILLHPLEDLDRLFGGV